MATQTGSPARILPPESRHGFFKTLPREIRDDVYDMLYQEIEYDFQGRLSSLENSTLKNLHVPLVSLRLVNHQFKLEYDERVAKTEHLTALTIHDQKTLPEHRRSKFGALFSRATNMTIYLNICSGDHVYYPCYHIRRLINYANWIGRLASNLPHLRSIRVSLTTAYDQCMEALEDTFLACVTNMSKVIEVQIRHTTSGNQGYIRNASDAPIVAVWTKETGLVHDHEAVKYCREGGLMSGRRGRSVRWRRAEQSSISS